MVIGYALGNRSDLESDIDILRENDPDVVTFSKTLPVVLSRMCRNDCPYCAFHRRDTLTVPYSTIRICKKARTNGAREALYAAGERPDKFPHIRATLDLWGFPSYLDYLYAVCELGFLEGLIPVIEVGFLTPEELKRMSEIAAVVKLMLDSVDKDHFDTIYPRSPGKKLELRARQLMWAGKLKFPTATGIMVGIGETKAHRKEALSVIAGVHKEYGTIHEVLIQNFVPQPKTQSENKKPVTKQLMLETVEMARSILPDDITINVPFESNPDIEDFIKAGVRDLGRIFDGTKGIVSDKIPAVSMEELEQRVNTLGLRLHQRFPLKRAFIKEGFYSKKLGQVFDAYRYKIKKEGQEKVKDTRTVKHGA